MQHTGGSHRFSVSEKRKLILDALRHPLLFSAAPSSIQRRPMTPVHTVPQPLQPTP